MKKFTHTPARKLVKSYMSPSASWEEFEDILDRQIERVANDKYVSWQRTPSVEADETFKNICRRAGVSVK